MDPAAKARIIEFLELALSAARRRVRGRKKDDDRPTNDSEAA
jgi:hypothetical protein